MLLTTCYSQFVNNKTPYIQEWNSISICSEAIYWMTNFKRIINHYNVIIVLQEIFLPVPKRLMKHLITRRWKQLHMCNVPDNKGGALREVSAYSEFLELAIHLSSLYQEHKWCLITCHYTCLSWYVKGVNTKLWKHLNWAIDTIVEILMKGLPFYEGIKWKLVVSVCALFIIQ